MSSDRALAADPHGRIRHDLDLYVCLPPQTGIGALRCCPARWVAYEDGEWVVSTRDVAASELAGNDETPASHVLVFLLTTLLLDSA